EHRGRGLGGSRRPPPQGTARVAAIGGGGEAAIARFCTRVTTSTPGRAPCGDADGQGCTAIREPTPPAKRSAIGTVLMPAGGTRSSQLSVPGRRRSGEPSPACLRWRGSKPFPRSSAAARAASSTAPKGPTDRHPGGGDTLSAGDTVSAVLSAAWPRGGGGGSSLASFKRGSRAMLSFTGGGGGSSIQCDHAKYARLTNSSVRNTFRTRPILNQRADRYPPLERTASPVKT